MAKQLTETVEGVTTTLKEGTEGKFRGTNFPPGWTWDKLGEGMRDRYAAFSQDQPVVNVVKTTTLADMRVWFEQNALATPPNAVVTAIAAFIDALPRSSAWNDRLQQRITQAQVNQFLDLAGAQAGATAPQIAAAKSAFATRFFT